ncbi:hypothetical protein [Vibrio sp. SCSIO 43136]|uniref:hypothetical protein n=1 Tax=Vibrio sp. SCSIO 43136 TaxID=2819101 RepID=UPI002075CB12|nr:hypothetical protein [Vibrio sp. SCSIO 43136]USD67743.1 hypothetical protein J4N39_16275 [Vibrio sp. SCSIO 43136]
MSGKQTLYADYFRTQEQFLATKQAYGFESEIVSRYINSAVMLSDFHQQQSPEDCRLLSELFLRQVYFHLLEAISCKQRSAAFRRVCFESIYVPLLNLKRFYDEIENGELRFVQLKQELQFVQVP